MLARFLTKNDFSYCTDCYQRIFTKNCLQCETGGTEECHKCPAAAVPVPCWQCGLAITGRDLRLVRRERQWHQACLQCCHCHSPLAGQSFSWRQDQPYCLPCINTLFSKTCEGCPKPIRNYLQQCPAVLAQSRDSLLSESGGGRFISLAGRYWHSSCFLCTVCSVSLVDTGFIAEAQEILCQDCAEYRAAQ